MDTTTHTDALKKTTVLRHQKIKNIHTTLHLMTSDDEEMKQDIDQCDKLNRQNLHHSEISFSWGFIIIIIIIIKKAKII